MCFRWYSFHIVAKFSLIVSLLVCKAMRVAIVELYRDLPVACLFSSLSVDVPMLPAAVGRRAALDSSLEQCSYADALLQHYMQLNIWVRYSWPLLLFAFF